MTPAEKRSIRDAAIRGAKFLDEHDPKWWRPRVKNAIRLETLNICDGETCILGQRFGSYHAGADAVGLADPYGREARSLGLAIGMRPDGGNTYITAYWRREILRRREAA